MLTVYFDHYLKFINQVAAYNTLSRFLSSLPRHDNANKLVPSLVKNLEKNKGIARWCRCCRCLCQMFETNKILAGEVLTLVKENYQPNLSLNNKQGITIYYVRNQLFLPAGFSQKINLAKELGMRGRRF